MPDNYTSPFQSLSKATGISAQPKRNFIQQIAENYGGIPLRKDYYKFTPKQDIFMKLASILAPTTLGGIGSLASKGVNKIIQTTPTIMGNMKWNPPNTMVERGGETAYNILRSGVLRNQDDDFYNHLISKLGGRSKIIN